MRDFRFKKMLYIQKQLQKEKVKLTLDNPDLNALVFRLFDKKLQKPSVRAYFVWAVSEYIKEYVLDECVLTDYLPEQWDKVFGCQLPFVIETTMVIMYLHNQIYDAKYGVETKQKIRENVQAANLLERQLYYYIQEHFNSRESELITTYVQKMLDYVEVGQWAEQTYNHYDSYGFESEKLSISKEIDDFINLALEPIQSIIQEIQKEIPNKAEFIHNYFKRITLTTGSLFILTVELIGELLHCKYQEMSNLEPLLNFVRVHGVMRQVVNDVCDFIVGETAAKNKKDCCKDLINKNITLPLIFDLESNDSTSLVKDYLNDKITVDTLDHIVVAKELINSKAIFKAMKYGQKLVTLSENYSNNLEGKEKFLLDLNSIANNNKFYHQIFQLRNQMKNCKGKCENTREKEKNDDI